jgi:hypothetical protein
MVFVGDISIVNGIINQQTSLGGTTLYQCCVENLENAGLGTWALVAHTDTSLPPG